MDAKSAVTAFNDCIGRRDLACLSGWMTNDHTFIDTGGNAVSGKSRCTEAWRGFFAAFPDYRNVFERIEVRGDDVVIAGRSECSNLPLSGAALWRARLADGKIAEWRVYEDNPVNRQSLHL